MAFVWTPFGVAGLIAGLTAWAAAVFILRTTPNVIVRRRFALLLFAEGLMILTSFAGPAAWIGDGTLYRYALLLHAVNDGLIVAVYLPTLAAVLDTPMVRVFKTLPGMLIPVFLGGVSAIGAVLYPDLAWTEPFAAPEGYGGFHVTPGPINQFAFLMLTIGYFYGLVATILAWRRADTALSRRRNGFLALAFGTRDLFWGSVFFLGVFLTVKYAPEPIPPEVGIGILVAWAVQLAAWGLILYVLLLAYGIATEHLFDIDLKVKWTLQRGTVAAAYVAVFFVVSEGTAAFLSEQVGTVVGLIATGALLFGLAPIQRLAEQLSHTAMPNVHDTPEYRKFRKLEIYGEAFAEAQRQGGPSAVQRVALERLREALELPSNETTEFEQQLAAT